MYWYPRLTRVVRRLPIGERLKRLFLRGIFRPGRPAAADAILETLIAACRAKAQTLRDPPHVATARASSRRRDAPSPRQALPCMTARVSGANEASFSNSGAAFFECA
ncbi:MAG: hypothetical protein QOH21_2756 [Acidobacteriota bacterium]|nr:hypothetical protein [Acidobacteriota bacterium]